jgi:hypothetical protein
MPLNKIKAHNRIESCRIFFIAVLVDYKDSMPEGISYELRLQSLQFEKKKNKRESPPQLPKEPERVCFTQFL